MKKRKNIFLLASSCFIAICLLMLGVYSATKPSVSVSGKVSYTVRDAKVMVQGKLNGTKQYPKDVDYKQPTDINNLSAEDKLVDSQNQFLNFTAGQEMNNPDDNLGVWNLGTLNFYEDQNGLRNIRLSFMVTNLSSYSVKATLTVANNFDNATVEANKTQSFLAGYNSIDNTSQYQSILTSDEFVVEINVTDKDKNANLNDFKINISFERYIEPEATLDKITFDYNKDLYASVKDLSYNYYVFSETSPQGLKEYYVAQINQDATGQVVIPAKYNDGVHGTLPVVPGRVNELKNAYVSGKSNFSDFISYFSIPNVTSVILHSGIKEVLYMAFASMTSLTEVQIPSSLLYHQGGTFCNSTNLVTIDLPYGTEKLWAYYRNSSLTIGMFHNCTALENFWIPNTVTYIGKCTFYYCSSLTSINIPSSVTEIGQYSYDGCTNLSRVNITDMPSWLSISFIYGGNPLKYAHNLYLNGELVTEVTIPSGFTKVNDYIFYGCTNLETVTIPNGVTSIGDCAFDECSSLRYIEIPNSVTSIGYSAFCKCTALVSIDIPSGVTTIKAGTFMDCTSLTRVDITDLTAWLNTGFLVNSWSNGSPNVYSNPLRYAKNLYLNGELVTEVTVPSSITKLQNYVFYNCTSLKSVHMSDSVTSIGEYSFYDCKSLLSINIPSSVNSIGRYSFHRCASLNNLNIAENCQLTSIPECTFYLCRSLTTINIPTGVTNVGDRAFEGCTALRNENNLYGNAYYIGNSSNPYLILLSVKNMAEYEINSNTRVIHSLAFSSCTSLTSITIPKNVTSIGVYAFYDCRSLTTVTINATTPPNAGNYIFNGCSNLTDIYVPAESVEAYKTAEGWKTYASKIQPLNDA